MDRKLFLNDKISQKDKIEVTDHNYSTIKSSIKIINDEAGEVIFEDLHNKTVIAGSALLAMKMFNLDRGFLNNTPTYNEILGLDDNAAFGSYPSTAIYDNNGNQVAAFPDETQRKIIGFCVGQGGCGTDISDVFDVKYASWIVPDALVPFRYPLQSADNVDEDIYKGRKAITLSDGRIVNAYYFKAFSNSPIAIQNYTSQLGTYTDSINASTIYSDINNADRAQTIVEMHLKITVDDTREFFIAHKGLQDANISQISLVSAWERDIEITKLNLSGNSETKTIQQWCDIRPFSVLNIPKEALSSKNKSLSIIYTLYF